MYLKQGELIQHLIHLQVVAKEAAKHFDTNIRFIP